MDRVECDHNQGLLRKWQVYGPKYCNEVKKSLIDTELYTIEMRNDLMVSHFTSNYITHIHPLCQSTSSKVRGLTGAIAAYAPEWPLDEGSSFLDMG